MTRESYGRRQLLKLAALFPWMSGVGLALLRPSRADAAAPRSRVRPADAAWPSQARWQQLAEEVGPAFIRVRSPLAQCTATPAGADCGKLFEAVTNPYYNGDEVGLTQTLGWVDAWTSSPSVYAVAARSTRDVVAAVTFARENNLRLVVKGGGHSYQGTSNAPDSLMLWTRRMNGIEMHESFVPAGCAGQAKPVRAVSVGAGAMWGQAYDAVTTRAGGYVQGGGCMTVGVAGLVLSGGFGSFSKAFGTASANLLEAEVVTADGTARIANACTNPDLFWALKGGGGGSFGIVTRVTLRVHPLPEKFGAVNMTIKAASPQAYRRLIGMVVDFCARSLLNPHWGEQVRFRRDDTIKVSMVFQGLDRGAAQAVWKPFIDAVEASKEFEIAFEPLKVLAVSARTFWAPSLFKRMLGFMKSDDRANAPEGNVYWAGDKEQSGQFLHGYQSLWLPAALLKEGMRPALADAIFAATRHWGFSFHFNKGLAGAPAEAIAAARDSAMNPAVLEAFALAICGAGEGPAYPDVPGHEPDKAAARESSKRVARAMDELRKLAPASGSYYSESNFFEPDWQRSFWGSNYPRLLAVKDKYDPGGLFFVHHGVGSERWSADGFTPQPAG